MAKDKLRILLIEDEEMLANMYEIKFKNEGFELTKALDGAKGLELSKTIKPDFILLDIIMPKMDGFSVLKALKDDPQTKDVPVMLLTNLGQEEDVKKGKELGAVGYLVKANITPAEVVSKVKEELVKLK
ncbi:MAG: response regulator [Candidatus Komeilibacteria bacterium CG11_big_fil_rev_8_21_14_0_20_36_20]|uniref:Response regulator n=1 Tax=Candidatus Komeilibacteria bacterium CG11_big_fil_rev_8_21_14_0_20_36_20 TaxID=1974477 RepID=A0A2H0NDS8_9BACT|nr:MAG: response regulator [Candidatus Komeilibacteria bacterium CG11_big_fil_rev_8_21_14_0_20_36_20]PIR81417.1 MAG: response regulator [Candidatus Komeilibacteria bacterium CG10_big_fil_rev_8_21_14_0_10_36_65]PJC55143.1 MAG: response regulator [Candidatus Komeilibacteria bacterium CG_4_9_14_0_2_um_filter_36_13]